MKEISCQQIIDEYIRISEILRETYIDGDSKRGNKEGKKLIRLFKKMENNVELARESLAPLLYCDNDVARMKAAAACVSLNIFVQDAKKVFEEVKMSGENIIAFNAEMTLKVWREQGYLKVYPTQEIRMTEYPQ